jgi:hypothetical protein
MKMCQQSRRVVSDDGVHLRGDEVVPIRGSVGSPGVYLQVRRVGFCDEFRSDECVAWTDDGRVSGLLRDRKEALRLPFIERGAADPGGEFPHGMEDPPVEAEKVYSRLDFVATYGGQNRFCETHGRQMRIALDFQVEMETARKSQYLIERSFSFDGVVTDEEPAVGCDEYIEFDRIDAEADRVLKTGYGVFRPPGASATVAMNLRGQASRPRKAAGPPA